MLHSGCFSMYAQSLAALNIQYKQLAYQPEEIMKYHEVNFQLHTDDFVLDAS